MNRLAAIALLAFFLTGCVTTNYNWGNYEQGLYDHYKDPSTDNDFLIDLEKHVLELEKQGIVPAPGMFAEVGTLYLQTDNAEAAITYYEKEKNAWPESEHLMSALIKSLKSNLTEGEA